MAEIDISTIDMNELKAQVKELNALEGVTEKIKVVGISKQAMVDKFAEQIVALDAAEVTLPEPMVDFYNSMFTEAAADPGAGAADPAADKDPAKDKPKTPKKKEPNPRIVFMETLVAKGTLTKKEIVDQTLAQFPDISKSTISTNLTDGKNPKYCPFTKLLKIDDESKVVSYAE